VKVRVMVGGIAVCVLVAVTGKGVTVTGCGVPVVIGRGVEVASPATLRATIAPGSLFKSTQG